MNKPTTKIVAIVLILICCALSAMSFALSVKDDADTAIVAYTVAIDSGIRRVYSRLSGSVSVSSYRGKRRHKGIRLEFGVRTSTEKVV